MIRVITTNPTGGGFDITELIDGLSWSSVNPGGDERATFTFKRSWFSNNPEIAKGSLVRIEDGLQRLWTGRIEERSRGTNTTEEITVTCYGLGNRVKDNLMSMIYVDRDISAWEQMGASRRLWYATNGYTYADGPISEQDVTPTLTLAIGNGTTNPVAEAWYQAGPENRVAFIYYEMTSKSVSTLIGTIGASDDLDGTNVGNTADLLTGTNSSATGTFSASLSNPSYAQYGFIQFLAGGGYTASGDQRMSIKNLIVRGAHGITPRGSGANQGYFDSDIVQHVISQVPGVTARQLDTGSFVIQQAAYKDKVQPEQIINDASQYENRDWGTWGSDNLFDTDTNAQFDYKLKDGSTRHWTVSRYDAEDVDLADELAGLFDIAVVKYTDEAGQSRSVTRTANVPELVDAGMSPKTLEITGGTLTQAGAETLGDIALAFYGGFAPARGSITLKGNATHYQRGIIPAHFMRADGSNIQVRDILPSSTALGLDTAPDRRTTFPVKRVAVDASGPVPVTTVDLDQTNDRLTQLQARTGITAQVTLG